MRTKNLKKRNEKKRVRKYFLVVSFVLLTLIFTLCDSAEAATIKLTSPVGGEVYVSGESMPIGWELDLEGDAADSIIVSYIWGGSSVRHYIRSIFDSTEFFEGTYDWTVPTVSEMSYLRIEAKVVVDGGGTVATYYSNHVKIIPSTSTPSIFLSYPRPESNGTLVLEGGSECVITWDVTGCASHAGNAMQIRYSLDGGLTYHGIVILFPCDAPREYRWTVPEVNTTRAKIKLNWGDLDWSTSVYNFTITTEGEGNSPPTADAGSDQTVSEGSTVILSGSGSSDPDGDSLSYEWEQIDSLVGYDVVLHDADTSIATFVAPDPGPEPKILTFRLTVTDPDAAADPDTLNVTVNPSGPTITSFTPGEGWFKKPITLHGSDLAGAGVYMHGTRVATAPYASDTEFTFYLPDLEDLGSTHITVSNLAGSFTTADTFNVLPVPYQWDWGFNFHNPGGFSLSWSDYDRCFGHGAVTWEAVCCEWDGIFCERACHDPLAQLLFDYYVEDLSQPGTCWGVSVASLKYFYGDLALDPREELRDLVYNYDHVTGISREIRKLHISQVSAEVIEYLVDHIDETPSEILARIEADLDANQPGVISIQNLFEGLELFDMEGHAVVPVHLEQVNPREWRIYVYDSNRERFSISRDNTDTDEYEEITDWDNYPYIRIFTAGERWSFEMAGGTLWEADTRHNITISSDLGDIDIPFYGISYYPRSIAVRDNYTLPTSLRGLGMILFGSADSGVEDSEGNTLGYGQDGRLHFEIAGGVPVTPIGNALFSERELYVLPDEGDYQVNIYGKEEGEYSWHTLGEDTLFAIEDAETHAGTYDTATLRTVKPDQTDSLSEEKSSVLTFETSDSGKQYSVTITSMIPSVSISGTTQRVFKVMDTTISQGDRARFGVTNHSDSLVYVNNSGQAVNFDLYLSQVKLSPQPEPPDSEDMIPVEECSILQENIEIQPHTALRMTPTDWENLGETPIQYDVVDPPDSDPSPIPINNNCPVEEIFGEHAEKTELLRHFRDSVLSKTPEGQELIKLYYELSPMLVKEMEADETLKREVKEMIEGILPLIKIQGN